MSKDGDYELLRSLPKPKLIELLLIQARNMFRVDGLYFLAIEEKFGAEKAIEIDEHCWRTMGAIEAREIKKLLGKSRFAIADVMEALRFTGWSLDQRDKEIQVDDEKGIFRVVHCRTQLTRMRKGLSEFACKRVRHGYLEAFASELSPEIEVICKMCPPDRHSENSWCEWEFRPKDRH